MPIGTTPLNDGNHIPNLAFGTGTALKRKDALDAVSAALHAGFRHLDTAQVYRNEENVGDALRIWLGEERDPVEGDAVNNQVLEGGLFIGRRKREDVWVTTKFGSDKGPIEELKESLRKLRLDYVDLYLIHSPRVIHGRVEAAWREMEQARESGLARSIGVSNFDATDLEELLRVAKIKPAVNQIHLHPYIYQTSLATLQFCKENDIAVEAYGSLYPITQLPNGPVTPTLKAPSERLGATLSQILFLWVRAKQCVVVTTTNREERLTEYLGVGELGPLTEEEVRKIDEAAASYPLMTSHIQPLPLVLAGEKGTSPQQHTTNAVEEDVGVNDTRYKAFTLLLYGSIILSTHILQSTTQRYASKRASLGMAILGVIVDVVCISLWFRGSRKKKSEMKV